MRLPDDTVRCQPGDHLLTQAGGGWVLSKVQDFVAVARLVWLMRGDEPVELIEELPDGVGPAYDGAHLLLTVYQQRFDTREAALAALANGQLGDGTSGVCRALVDFPAARTEVIPGHAARA
jgi:hypothetical protein